MITGLALINEVEDRLGWRQTKTIDGDLAPDSRKMLRLLNRVLKSIQRLDDWPLLRRDGEILTVATISQDAYIDITNGGTTLGIGATEPAAPSGLTFSEEMVGRAVQIGGEKTLYRVASVESPTSLTLNKQWIGDTIADASTGIIIGQDQYALPEGFDRPAAGWESFLTPYHIEAIGPDKFKNLRTSRAGQIRTQAPEVFTIYGLTQFNYQQVLHLDPFPLQAQVLNYSYYIDHPEIENDESRVLVTSAKLDAVIEGMLYLATRDYTDDTKMEAVLRDYMRALNSAGGSPGAAEDISQLSPNMRQKYQRRNQWGRGVRINWGSLFDRSDRVGFP